MNKLNTKKQIAHAKWKNAVKTAQIAFDNLTLCQNDKEKNFWEKREEWWNKLAKEYRAEYLLAV